MAAIRKQFQYRFSLKDPHISFRTSYDSEKSVSCECNWKNTLTYCPFTSPVGIVETQELLFAIVIQSKQLMTFRRERC